MGYETILVDVSDHVGTISLNRPERLNAITAVMERELREALAELQADDQVRCLVLTGTGRGFCAGEDLGERPGEVPGRTKLRGLSGGLRAGGHLPQLFRAITKPTIAAVNGPAVGQGLSLALACDMRLASDRARLGAVWIKRGIPPESGGAFNLVRVVGLAKACELAFTGRIIEAQEALRIGLVNQVFPHESFPAEVRTFARSIAEGPPLAMALCKRSLYQALDGTLDQHLEWEHLALQYAFNTKDREEGIRSFLEKREARFQGE